MAVEILTPSLWLAFILLQSLAGYFLVKQKLLNPIVWLFTVLSIVVNHYLLFEYNGILRMLGLIIPLLHAMKIVVAQYHPKGQLSLSHWIVYYFFTVNMNPGVFNQREKIRANSSLLKSGLIHMLIGAFIIIILRQYAPASLVDESDLLFWLLSITALVSLSLILHFGLLPTNTFMLQLLKWPDYPVFRKPFKSKSLSEFWGSRWNIAFSEMTATAIFKPTARKLGAATASFVAFMVSGLLHEVAISLSVMKGFGLPMLYFLIHGILMTVEKKVFTKSKPGTVWVILCLVLPLPILFHKAFLLDVIWPILRMMK